MRRAACLLITVLALAATGCGGDKKKPTPAPKPPPRDLVTYLPADTPFVAAVDVVRARKEAGLPATADPLAADAAPRRLRPTTADERLSLAVSAAIPQLRAGFLLDDLNDPVVTALDGSQLTAAAANVANRGPLVTVLRTTQPFDDLARRLEGKQWRRDGDAVVAATGSSRVTDAGDGVVLYTDSRVDAAALAADPPGGPEGLDTVIGGADASSRFAFFPRGPGCVSAFGGWEEAGGGGVMRWVIDGVARPESIHRDLLPESLDIGTPSGNSERVQAPFGVPAGGDLSTPILDLVAGRQYDDLYRCDEGTS